MFGDQVDLIERLTFVRGATSRPISFMFGSGLSNRMLPSTSSLTELFVARLSGAARERFLVSDKGRAGGAVAYQEAARVLQLHQGDGSVAKVIRGAVLQACVDVGDVDEVDEAEARELVRDGQWQVPDGYKRFADYFASLDDTQRGWITTTNFDPFLELALREAGLQADPLSLQFDSPPTRASLSEHSALQVIHLHGYFANGFSLNTVSQLSSARLNTENFLRGLYAGSSLMVLGYGGWNDVFTQVLTRHAAQQTLEDAEVIWAAHSDSEPEVLANPVISGLANQPGFQLFLGIDGDRVFGAERSSAIERIDALLPRSFRQIPPPVALAGTSPIEFAQGSVPTWNDANPKQWPELASTIAMGKELRAMLKSGNGAVAAIGPMGEGKTMGVKQLALSAAIADPHLAVLWREPGAPPLDVGLVEGLLESRPVLLCLDDADLAIQDIARLQPLWSASGSGLSILMACQDRLWSTLPRTVTGRVHVTNFEGLTSDDALAIATRWGEFEIIPKGRGGAGIRGAADALYAAAQHNPESHRTTLFGAILEVRESGSLQQRVDALMESLDSTLVVGHSSRTLADVFGSICVLQYYLDTDRDGRRGATRDHIHHLVMADNVEFGEAVLATLGREASITFSGNRVFARHASIAAAVVDWLRRQERLAAVCEMTGRAGGELRGQSLVSREDYDAYMLWRAVPDSAPALAAAKGAIEGAPRLLEPRINYIAAARRHDQPERASAYGQAVAPGMADYSDKNSAGRIFLTELSIVMSLNSEPQLAVGLAALSLHDHAGTEMSPRSMSFAWRALLRALELFDAQRSAEAEPPVQTVLALTPFFSWTDSPGPYRALSRRIQVPPSLQTMSAGALSVRLATQLTSIAKYAILQLDLPFGVPDRGGPWVYRFGGVLEYSKFPSANISRLPSNGRG